MKNRLKPRLLLLGGTGFVGSHFLDMFKHKYNIFSVGKNCDITIKSNVESIVSQTKPDFVVNLAAITTLRAAERNLKVSTDVIFVGELNLLNVLNAIDFNGSHLYVSSGEVYGNSKINKNGYTEASEVLPDSVYGQCKYFAEKLCLEWDNNHKYKINVARPFNHIGARQSADFAIANFAKQISEIKKYRLEDTIHVGDLKSQRDFLDVSEVVTAYETILTSNLDRELFNVCSGKPLSLRYMLDKMVEISGVQVNIKVDTDLLRKSAKPRVFGDNTKIKNRLNFTQAKSLDITLKEILDFWYLNV